MPDIKDRITQFENKSIESNTSKHGDESVQQKPGAGSRVKETQVQSHAEQGLRKRRVQTASGRALPTPPSKKRPLPKPPKQRRPLPAPPTSVKIKRDQAAIEALYKKAQIELYAQNYQKAESLFTEAAEAGHGGAALSLARAYSIGIHFGKNPEKTFRYTKIAADSGDVDCLKKLAYYYKEGIGVAQDYAKARDYYTKAVAAGEYVKQIIFDELECEGLTDYQKGERFEQLAEEKIKAGSKGIETYLLKAKYFYKAALDISGAKEKTADMMFRIAELYEKGIDGNEVDLKSALLIYQDALEEGSPLAKAKLADIERLLRESYESGQVLQGELTQQPLVSYIKEKAATFDEAMSIIYGKNAGFYFERTGDFLKAAGYYFMEDQNSYKRMIAPLQLERKNLPQPKEQSVQKPPSDNGILFMIDQGSLLVNFSRFMNQLAVLSPNSYNQAEIDRIGAEMERGHCNGFSFYYAMLALSTNEGKVQDKTEKYATLMGEICDWDRPLFEPPSGFSYDKFRAGDKQGLTEDEIERLAFTDKFKTLVQMIRYGQQQFGEIKEMNKGAEEGEKIRLGNKNIQLLLGDEFVSQINIYRKPVMVREALNTIIPLMEVGLTESNVGLLSYSTDPWDSHIVSINFREGKYFYFDSNQAGFEKNYDPRYSAIACDTLDQVIDLIVKHYKIDNQLKGNMNLQVVERTDVKG